MSKNLILLVLNDRVIECWQRTGAFPYRKPPVGSLSSGSFQFSGALPIEPGDSLEGNHKGLLRGVIPFLTSQLEKNNKTPFQVTPGCPELVVWIGLGDRIGAFSSPLGRKNPPRFSRVLFRVVSISVRGPNVHSQEGLGRLTRARAGLTRPLTRADPEELGALLGGLTPGW